MATQAQPILLRDVSMGRISKNVIGNGLVPANSTSNSINVLYDKIVGQGVVRPGSTRLGDTVVANKRPLGLSAFVSNSAPLNYLLAVFQGNTSATLHYFNGTAWSPSSLTTLDNNARVRFATLKNSQFLVNGVNPMMSSTDGVAWGTDNCIPAPIIPFLVLRAKSRLLVATKTPTRDRIYFSSVVDPLANPFISWNTDPVTGDWIDINPDDGQTMTGWADTANQVLIFKTSAMYRLNVVTKTVDTDNITNVGAVSQEAITVCQGLCYFYSGKAVYVTDGGAPQQISRAGIQDLLDSIPMANRASVSLGSDENNVYVSVGACIINGIRYEKVQFKFSVRDNSWSPHSYQKQALFFAEYETATGLGLFMATPAGDVVEMNSGTTDDGTPIFYQLDTQELECGNRAHVKSIGDEMIVFCDNGQASELYYSADGKDFNDLKAQLNDRVNILEEVGIEFRFLVFRWMGNSSGPAPVFEGIQVENIIDQGVQGKQE